MLDYLPEAPEGLFELTQGPLWLAARKGRKPQGADACLALEGFIAFGEEGPQDLTQVLNKKKREPGWDLRFDGHYVLVWADTKSLRLDLFRDPTGGLRLYYARIEDLLLFSASAKCLSAHGAIGRRLNQEIGAERALCGLSHWGNETLWAGINEVLPGYRLEASPGGLDHLWHWGDLLQGALGHPQDLAQQLGISLRRAVRAAIGKDQRVAVALSGGIDSSAIAALAVETAGAENVHAFTYEFDSPDYIPETDYARLVCRHLGIKKHHVFKITQQQHLDGGLEMLWRSEDFINRIKPYPSQLARVFREQEFSKFLTGDGVGSRMAWFEDLAQILPRIPWPQQTLRYWNLNRKYPDEHCLDFLDFVHPGFPPPYRHLYLMILGALHHHGIIRDVGPFFPPGVGEAARQIVASPRMRQAMNEIRHLPLSRQLQHLSFAHLSSSIDISRTEAFYRELGVLKVSPAFFPSCLALTHFPHRPKPSPWSARRRLQPGKDLLLEIMRGILPPEVLYRPKIWIQASAPVNWIKSENDIIAQRTLSSGILPPFYENNERFIKWNTYKRGNFIALGFWHRMFMEAPLGRRTPSWEQLQNSARPR